MNQKYGLKNKHKNSYCGVVTALSHSAALGLFSQGIVDFEFI